MIVIVSSLASKLQDLKFGMLVFQPLSLKSWHFEAKFQSQGLHIIRIKYGMLVGVASLPHSQPLEHRLFTV